MTGSSTSEYAEAEINDSHILINGFTPRNRPSAQRWLEVLTEIAERLELAVILNSTQFWWTDDSLLGGTGFSIVEEYSDEGLVVVEYEQGSL